MMNRLRAWLQRFEAPDPDTERGTEREHADLDEVRDRLDALETRVEVIEQRGQSWV